MAKFVVRLLRFPVEAVFVFFVLLDEVARPFYRPLIRWVASLQIAARFEAWVAAQHRFVILILLVVPFVIIEPMKVVALIWIGCGAIISGGLTLALAYLAGFVLLERIYSAGRTKLLTISWFAKLMAVRAAAAAWIRQTAAWQAVAAAKSSVTEGWRRMKDRLSHLMP